jgi:hypothetical protein
MKRQRFLDNQEKVDKDLLKSSTGEIDKTLDQIEDLEGLSKMYQATYSRGKKQRIKKKMNKLFSSEEVERKIKETEQLALQEPKDQFKVEEYVNTNTNLNKKKKDISKKNNKNNSFLKKKRAKNKNEE